MQQVNPYKKHLDDLFDRIIELRHTSSNINSTLKASLKRYESYQVNFLSGSALVISDWSGPTDNGWEINFLTGFRKITLKENYDKETQRIVSQQCCYAFAQSFDALEKFFKDCIFEKGLPSKKCLFGLIKKYPKNIKRESLNGIRLFKMVKMSGDPYFSKYSENNNKSLRFKELWTILSECRHSITHSKSIITVKKLKKSEYHFKVFSFLFMHSKNADGSLIIELDFKKLSDVLDIVAEFACLVYKSISLKENLPGRFSKKIAAHDRSVYVIGFDWFFAPGPPTGHQNSCA